MKIEHLSVSRTQLWEECQKKYFYKYHLGLKSNFPEQPWFEYGKVIHRSAELFVEHKGETPIGNFASKILTGEIPLEVGQDPKKIKLSVDYAKKLSPHLKSVEKITREKLGFTGDIEWDFMYDLDSPNKKMLKGFIDRLIVKSDGLHLIIDYKTTKKGPYRKNKDTIKYDLQMQTYALVVRDTLKVDAKNIRLALYYLEGSDFIPVKFEDKVLDDCKNKLLRIYDKIKDTEPDDAIPSVGYHCSRCEYRDICPWSKK